MPAGARRTDLAFAPEAFTSDATWYDLRPKTFPFPERYTWPGEPPDLFPSPRQTPWDRLAECGEIGFRISLRYYKRLYQQLPNPSEPIKDPATKVPLFLPFQSYYPTQTQVMLVEIMDRYPHLGDLFHHLLFCRALAIYEGEYDRIRKTESWALVIRKNELIEASLSADFETPAKARDLRSDLRESGFGQFFSSEE